MTVVVLILAVVLAIIANSVVYLIVTGPLGEPMMMCSDCGLEPPVLAPMTVVDPIIFSAIFGTGAVVVYAIIRKMSSKPLSVFAVVALMVLLASLVLPTRMPSPPVEQASILALVAMHVVGYGAILGTLWFARRRGWLEDR